MSMNPSVSTTPIEAEIALHVEQALFVVLGVVESDVGAVTG